MGGLTSLLLLLCVGVTVSSVVDLHKRVHGGVDCGAGERRYHVILITDGMCGGSLISDRWILTAAHCWVDGRDITAYLGFHPKTDSVGRAIVPITAHEIYKDEHNRTHDIMLLQLQDTTSILPAELPNCANRPTRSDVVQIAGNGPRIKDPSNPQPPTTTLLCAYMNVTQCPWHANPVQSNHREAYQNKFCGQAPGIDTCKADSGSGVVYNNRLYGVHSTSGKIPCAQPAAFMDVCGYKDWIRDITGVVIN